MKPMLVLLALLSLGLGGCQKNVPTADGTEVLAWDRARSSRPEIVSAKVLGTPTKTVHKLLATPKGGDSTPLEITLESQELEVVTSGATVVHSSPVSLRVRVAGKTAWTVRGSCSDGPHFQMGPMVEGRMSAPKAMILQCNVVLEYVSTTKDLTYGVAIAAFGDGKLEESMAAGAITPLP